MNRNQILDYLKIVFDLEKKLYEVTRVRDAVDKQLFKCENPDYILLQSVPNKPSKYTYLDALQDTLDWIVDNFKDGIWLLVVFFIIAGGYCVCSFRHIYRN